MSEINYISMPAHPVAFRAGRGEHKIQSIILHSSCGHKSGDIPTLRGEDHEHLVSAHWYVDKAGNYYHFVNNDDTAFHAGVVCDPKYSNACSIGIEQEHLDGQEAWPDVQVQATARLCVALRQRYGEIEIAHHATVACPPGRKTDPVAFPSDVFWQAYSEAPGEEWEFSQIQ